MGTEFTTLYQYTTLSNNLEARRLTTKAYPAAIKRFQVRPLACSVFCFLAIHFCPSYRTAFYIYFAVDLTFCAHALQALLKWPICVEKRKLRGEKKSGRPASSFLRICRMRWQQTKVSYSCIKKVSMVPLCSACFAYRYGRMSMDIEDSVFQPGSTPAYLRSEATCGEMEWIRLQIVSFELPGIYMQSSSVHFHCQSRLHTSVHT